MWLNASLRANDDQALHEIAHRVPHIVVDAAGKDGLSTCEAMLLSLVWRVLTCTRTGRQPAARWTVHHEDPSAGRLRQIAVVRCNNVAIGSSWCRSVGLAPER